jgi:cytochrome c-type biogenesis protein CcmH/NrfG
LDAFRQALLHDPSHIPARFNLGLMLNDRGDLAEAIQQFEAVLRERPSHAQAQQALENARAALRAEQGR